MPDDYRRKGRGGRTGPTPNRPGQPTDCFITRARHSTPTGNLYNRGISRSGASSGLHLTANGRWRRNMTAGPNGPQDWARTDGSLSPTTCTASWSSTCTRGGCRPVLTARQFRIVFAAATICISHRTADIYFIPTRGRPAFTIRTGRVYRLFVRRDGSTGLIDTGVSPNWTWCWNPTETVLFVAMTRDNASLARAPIMKDGSVSKSRPLSVRPSVRAAPMGLTMDHAGPPVLWPMPRSDMCFVFAPQRRIDRAHQVLRGAKAAPMVAIGGKNRDRLVAPCWFADIQRVEFVIREARERRIWAASFPRRSPSISSKPFCHRRFTAIMNRGCRFVTPEHLPAHSAVGHDLIAVGQKGIDLDQMLDAEARRWRATFDEALRQALPRIGASTKPSGTLPSRSFR